MALKLSRTSCVFRQIPIGRLKVASGKREMQAANDNVVRHSPGVDATPADESPSLADVGPILALIAISGGTFYLISSVLSGYVKSFPMLYP
jgi:hypothetical protein